MKKYLLIRVLKSFVSIFIVLSIVILLVFNLVPRFKIFENDETFRKLKGDDKQLYMLTKYEELGYLDLISQRYCQKANLEQNDCQIGNPKFTQALENVKNKQYEVVNLVKNNVVVAYHDYNF